MSWYQHRLEASSSTYNVVMGAIVAFEVRTVYSIRSSMHERLAEIQGNTHLNFLVCRARRGG